MNTKFLSTVAAVALMGSAAFAQTSGTSTETDATGQPVVPEASTGADTGATGSTETAPMPADGATSAEGDAAMPADDAMDTETTGGDTAMPADGAETDMDATEGDAAMPAEGTVDTEAAEGDAAMPAEGAADAEMATDGAAGDDRAALYGSFADAHVTDIVGMNVLSANGDDIGEVDDLIHDGEAVMAVVGVGGFLGLGEHKVALPLADFTMGEDALQIGEMSKEDLEAMPEYAGDAESLPLDTTVSGEPVAQEELMVDPAAGGDATAPSGG